MNALIQNAIRYFLAIYDAHARWLLGIKGSCAGQVGPSRGAPLVSGKNSEVGVLTIIRDATVSVRSNGHDVPFLATQSACDSRHHKDSMSSRDSNQSIFYIILKLRINIKFTGDSLMNYFWYHTHTMWVSSLSDSINRPRCQRFCESNQRKPD